MILKKKKKVYSITAIYFLFSENELYNFNIVRVGVQNAIHPSVQHVSVKNLATESLKNQASNADFNLEVIFI